MGGQRGLCRRGRGGDVSSSSFFKLFPTPAGRRTPPHRAERGETPAPSRGRSRRRPGAGGRGSPRPSSRLRGGGRTGSVPGPTRTEGASRVWGRHRVLLRARRPPAPGGSLSSGARLLPPRRSAPLRSTPRRRRPEPPRPRLGDGEPPAAARTRSAGQGCVRAAPLQERPGVKEAEIGWKRFGVGNRVWRASDLGKAEWRESRSWGS